MAVAYKTKIINNPAGTEPGAEKKARHNREAHVIETLGKLNDRHKKALSERDRLALIDIAGEYALIGCPILAGQVAHEAEGL